MRRGEAGTAGTLYEVRRRSGEKRGFERQETRGYEAGPLLGSHCKCAENRLAPHWLPCTQEWRAGELECAVAPAWYLVC